MSVPIETRAIVTGAVRDLRGTWRRLTLTDLVYKGVSIAVLTPATLLLLRWAMSRAGTEVIADVEIATFFLTTLPGVIALIVVGAMLAGITALELACLMAIGLACAKGRDLTVRAALRFGASRAADVVRLTANMVIRVLMAVLPFAAAVGLVYWTLLRDHDINYYLAERPPAFLVAVVIAGVMGVALIVLLARTVARWAIALPLVLFEDTAPRRALGESASRLAGARRPTLAAIAMWAMLAALLLAMAAWVPELLGRRLAPGFAESLSGLLGFIVGLALLWAGLGLVVSTVNASLFSLILVRLYLHAGEPQNLQLPGSAAADAAAMTRLPRAVRIGAAIVAALVVVGSTLVILSTVRRNQPVMVIAHRGASAAAPENTLAAFRLAGDQGADFVELDVQESADGEVVVAHDSDLMKIGGSPLKIWEATAAELRAVAIGSRAGPQFASERVPTLAEALAVCRGRSRVIVELKAYGHSQRLEERVVEIVEAAGMTNDTVFMSLNHEMVRKMKQLRPTWRVGILAAKAIGDLTTLGADFLAVQADIATRRFVERAHRAGQQVYVWTVNDPAWMIAAMSRGVDGLITDKPDVARLVVERRAAMSDAQRILVALLVRLGVRPEALVGEDAVR